MESQIPSLEEWPEAVMTNFDGSIDEAVARVLADGKHYAQYAGWNFCGYVWRDGEQWACEVWTYGSPREVVRAETLQDIMTAVGDTYGSE